MAYRARLHELVKRAECVLERRLLVVEVGVVEVDPFRLQAFERGLRLVRDRLRPQVAGLAAPTTDLRRDDELIAVPAPGEPAPDDRFRLAVLDHVRVSSVNEVATAVGIRIEDSVRLRLV